MEFDHNDLVNIKFQFCYHPISNSNTAYVIDNKTRRCPSLKYVAYRKKERYHMTSENNYSGEMANNSGNFRNATINEPRLFGGPYSMQTPIGTVRTSQPPPALPPRPFQQQASSYGTYGGISSMGYGSPYSSYGSPYSSYGSSYGFGSGLNSFGSYGGYGNYGGYGGYGSYGSGYNRFNNPMDPENRFIQIAEESSRPAFQSIESLVGAIGNIASMLDSTFFAITSSFRAILGVAANFGMSKCCRENIFVICNAAIFFRSITWSIWTVLAIVCYI